MAADEYLLVEIDCSDLMCGIWKDLDSGAALRRIGRPAEPPYARSHSMAAPHTIHNHHIASTPTPRSLPAEAPHTYPNTPAQHWSNNGQTNRRRKFPLTASMLTYP